MKKKFFSVILTLVLPLLILSGCGDVSSFPISVYSSDINSGSVSGTGTYNEKTTVTLLATAKSGSSVVGWVKNNSLLLKNGNGYSITNTLASNGSVSKSTLKFSSNETTQGQYTAVFEDTKMMYVKFDGIVLSTSEDASETTDSTSPELLRANINITQGNEGVTAFEANDLVLQEDVKIAGENVDQVLKLSTNSGQNIRTNFTFAYNSLSYNFSLRSTLTFQENTEGFIQSTNYAYRITYSDGVYATTYRIQMNDGTVFYLTIKYANLKAENNSNTNNAEYLNI